MQDSDGPGEMQGWVRGPNDIGWVIVETPDGWKRTPIDAATHERMTLKPQTPVHPYTGAPGRVFAVIEFVAIMGIASALFTLGVAIWAITDIVQAAPTSGEGETLPAPYSYRVLILLAIFWAVAPPCWFWIEYWKLYVPNGDGSDAAFAQFKHNQSLSTAIWAGILLLLGVLISTAF